MKTLAELLAESDAARRAVQHFETTNHVAYLKWPAAQRIEFDVGKARARLALNDAEVRYLQAITSAAQSSQGD